MSRPTRRRTARLLSSEAFSTATISKVCRLLTKVGGEPQGSRADDVFVTREGQNDKRARQPDTSPDSMARVRARREHRPSRRAGKIASLFGRVALRGGRAAARGGALGRCGSSRGRPRRRAPRERAAKGARGGGAAASSTGCPGDTPTAISAGSSASPPTRETTSRQPAASASRATSGMPSSPVEGMQTAAAPA